MLEQNVKTAKLITLQEEETIDLDIGIVNIIPMWKFMLEQDLSSIT